MILSPEQYGEVSTLELLRAAQRGIVGVDHRFLHAILDQPERTVPDLVRFGLEQRGDLIDDLVRMVRHLRTAEALPFLIDVVRACDYEMTVDLISAFQAIGEPALDPLLHLYHESGDDQQSDVGYLLATLGVRDPRLYRVLVERLQTDPIDAGHLLAAYGDPAAVPLLEQAIERTEDEWTRNSLRQSLERLHAWEPYMDAEPFDIWKLYPAEADPDFDSLGEAELREFLSSPDSRYRCAALVALSEPELPRSLWDAVFKKAKEDPDPAVRGLGWQTLADAWTQPEIREALRACVKREDAPLRERAGALVALAIRDGDKRTVQRWAERFYEIPEVRAKALQAMAATLEPRFAAYFPKHLADPDFDIRFQAVQGVGMLEISQAAPALVPLFDDQELRRDALHAYALSAPCPPNRREMRRLYERIGRLADLNEDEAVEVKEAVNLRLARHELEPLFDSDGELIEDPPVNKTQKVGRNDPCLCGSGKKYKKCCGA